MSFTKGEWHLDPLTGKIKSEDGTIAEVYGATVYNRTRSADECWSNARLICLAPEMYDELYEVLQLCEGKSCYERDEFASQARSIRELLSRIDGSR